MRYAMIYACLIITDRLPPPAAQSLLLNIEENQDMAQITEAFARDSLELCKRNQFPPLTLWETQQLIYAWLDRERIRNAVMKAPEAICHLEGDLS